MTIVIDPKVKDIGGFSVRRSLPSAQVRMVGPWTFFDHFGPTTIAAGSNSDVRPHPHIGLATVTTLFDGTMHHRDSLGFDQVIKPGDINWMTSGKGIVHSERAVDRARERHLHGLQLWVALPLAHEEDTPSFRHYEADALPSFDVAEGARVRLLAGEAFGKAAPVETLSPLFYVELNVRAGASVDLSGIAHPERALLVMDGAASIDGEPIVQAHLVVLDATSQTLRADSDVHAIILGGAPLDGPPRHAWWNFVSSSKERIEQARLLWRDGGFPRIPGDDTEFVPLPD